MERQTRQRNAIQAVIESYDRPLSPRELYEAARKHQPQLGIATVYRAIRDLVNSGWLRTVEIPGLAARYERARQAASSPLPVPRLQRAVGGGRLPARRRDSCARRLPCRRARNHPVRAV